MGNDEAKAALRLSQGDHNVCHGYYDYVISKLDRYQSILNVGSGSHFVFERRVREKMKNKNKHVKITSFDNFPLTIIPEGIDFVKGDISSAAIKNPFHHMFDCITCFETIEHLEDTDALLDLVHLLFADSRSANCIFMISFPNLASLFSRIELLLGFQPHILEVSNRFGPLGMGLMGRMNYQGDPAVHHIRGITFKAMKEFLRSNDFRIVEAKGFTKLIPFWPKRWRSLASTIVIICEPVRPK
jgi:hypothetical protein